jgi:hypothetical protein
MFEIATGAGRRGQTLSGKGLGREKEPGLEWP